MAPWNGPKKQNVILNQVQHVYVMRACWTARNAMRRWNELAVVQAYIKSEMNYEGQQ